MRLAIVKNDLVFPKMGKYNFTARWNDSKQVKGKPFNCDMNPDKNLFMKLKQFREQHRSEIY